MNDENLSNRFLFQNLKFGLKIVAVTKMLLRYSLEICGFVLFLQIFLSCLIYSFKDCMGKKLGCYTWRHEQELEFRTDQVGRQDRSRSL